MINKIGENQFSYINYATQTPLPKTKKDLTLAQKATILGSAGIGVSVAVAGLAKHKGFSLNPKKILATPIKDWAIFKFEPKDKVIKFEEPEIITVATSSVAGGFIGGSIIDKDNIKAKKREILNQILGNVLVPVGCVGAGSRVYCKYAEQLEKMMPQLKGSGKFVKTLNTMLKVLPNGAATLISLGIGIFAGNKVSNYLNEKIYHKKVDRDIKTSDFAPHVDDICMSVSMINKESTFGSKLGRVIPLALFVPGYEAGSARDDA